MVTANDFVISYSGGKDAAFACYLAMQSGLTPVVAVTVFDRENEYSWFHRFPESLLNRVESSLGIPVEIIDITADRYEKDFEYTIQSFGANLVVFGDVDIQEHYDWCDARCRNVGMKCVFPLWKMDRLKVVSEMIDAGFRVVITSIDTTKMNESYLGKNLTHELVSQMINDGIDPCGENGEFHTFAYDGPLFRTKIEYAVDKTERIGNRLYLILR